MLKFMFFLISNYLCSRIQFQFLLILLYIGFHCLKVSFSNFDLSINQFIFYKMLSHYQLLLNLNSPSKFMLENVQDLDYHIYKTYQVISQVGKGTYGLVYKVKHKKTQQLFAIKKICDAYQNIIDAKRTYRQLNYLLQLNHPCIVKLYHIMPGNTKASLNNQSNTSRIQNNYLNISSQYENMLGYITQKPYQHQVSNNKSKHVYAIFQYVQSDLAKALKNCTLQSIQRKYITYQILQGLSYLHKSKLIHRDIKPSNILIDSNCEIKICDFGLCRLKQDSTNERQMDKNIITEYVASRWYRPPQILLGFSPCNQAIDMWSTGCLMAELIIKTPFFQGTSTMDQLQKIFRVIGLPKQQEINNFETDEAKFLLKTFTFSRKNKPQKINELLHQALDQEIDLIQNLLQFNPNKRFSADEALLHPYFRQIQEMNCNFSSFNHPVKIIDSSIPSTLMGDLKNFGYTCQKSSQTHKKKQLTLQQYQSLIQQLQRATSRSSNRAHQQLLRYNYQGDRVMQNVNSKRSDDGYNKQKSTRESNFLYQHKLMDVRNKLKDKRQKQEIYKNQFMQYSNSGHNQQYQNASLSSKNYGTDFNQQIKLIDDNYNSNQVKTMKTYQNQLSSYQYQKKSSSIQQDLYQHYKDLYNQNNSKGHSKQISQNLKQTQKQKVIKQKSKNKSIKSIKSINTKSNSKISVDSKKEKSKKNLQYLQKNKESPIQNKFILTQGAIIDGKKQVSNLVNKKSKQKKNQNSTSKSKCIKKIEEVRTAQFGFGHKIQNFQTCQLQKCKKCENMQNSSLKNLSMSNKIYSPPLPQSKVIQAQGKQQPNISFSATDKNKLKPKKNYNKSRSKSKQSLHSNKNSTSYNFMGSHRQVQSSLSTHSFVTQKSPYSCGIMKETHKAQLQKFKKPKKQSLQKKSRSKNKPGLK